MNVPAGRADTPEKKAAVIDALIAAWARHPELRLGQLISCVLHDIDLHYVEDEALREALEERWRK